LHLGSLYTALASFLQARSQHGKWLLRIDDLDAPRNVKGAADAILNTLEICGLHWDDDVVYQSQCIDVYNDVLNELKTKQLLYPCTCSRKDLSTIYSGTCRNKTALPSEPYALRLKTDNRNISFEDKLQGLCTNNLGEQYGDFILKRKDEIIAYQFAVVVDDHQQQINQIVRGMDLLTETPKQIYLQQLLNFPRPNYMHIPIVIDENGYKLSKQTRATAVDLTTPSELIFKLLGLLKQNPPIELQGSSVTELIAWAIANWQTTPLKNVKQIGIVN
jgi:glutamyl-Q tRNA(Asp) synthetase